MDLDHINMGLGVDVNVTSPLLLRSSNNMNPKKKRRSINTTMQAVQRNAVPQDFIPPPLSGFGDTIVANNPFDDTPQAALSSSAQHIHNHHLHHPRNPHVQGIKVLPAGGLDSVMPHIGDSGQNGSTNAPVGQIRNLSNANLPPMNSTNCVSSVHSNASRRAIVSSNNHVNMNHSFNSQVGGGLGGPLVSNSINGINRSVRNSIGSHVGSSTNCKDPSHTINITAIVTSSSTTNSSFSQSASVSIPTHLNSTRSNLNQAGNIHVSHLNSSLPDAVQCSNQSDRISPLQSQMFSLQNVNPNPRIQVGHVGCAISSNLNSLSRKSILGVGTNIINLQHGYHMSPSLGSKTISESTGRVYPPDQPMVFNHQNPNAPPISPCGVCHKEVHANDQAILCESGCNFWFHRRCTGLSEMAYDLLMHEVCAEWACDRCMSSKNVTLIKFKP